MDKKKLTVGQHEDWVNKILYHYRTGLTLEDHKSVEVCFPDSNEKKTHPNHYHWVGEFTKQHYIGYLTYTIGIVIYEHGAGVRIHLSCMGKRSLCGAGISDGRTAKKLTELSEWSYRSVNEAIA